MANKLWDPELESLAIMHEDYHSLNQEGYLERDQLIMTDQQVKMVAWRIRQEQLIDNDISDWDLVTLEINIRLTQNLIGEDAEYMSRQMIWDDLLDWAVWYGEVDDRYLAYI